MKKMSFLTGIKVILLIYLKINFLPTDTTDEDNLVIKFLSVLAKKNFQNVSILEGGFDGISQILNKMSIELLNLKSWTPKNSSRIGSYTEIKDSPSYTNRQINESGIYTSFFCQNTLPNNNREKRHI